MCIRDSAKGRHNRSYDNMTRLQPGDIVFSHFAGALRYVGVVIEQAESSRKPDFGFAGDYLSLIHISTVCVTPSFHLGVAPDVEDD